MIDIFYFMAKYYYIKYFIVKYILFVSIKSMWLSSLFAFVLITFFYNFAFLEWQRYIDLFFMCDIMCVLCVYTCVKNCESRMPRDTRWKGFAACLITAHSFSFSYFYRPFFFAYHAYHIPPASFLARKITTILYDTNNAGKSYLSRAFFILFYSRDYFLTRRLH